MIIRDKWDIGTMAYKGSLIGIQLKLEDGTWKEVKDWYIDHATNMINIVFVEDDEDMAASSFRLQDKFVVKLSENIKPIKKKKIRKHK